NDTAYSDASLDVEHKFDRLQVDYHGGLSWSRHKLHQGGAGATVVSSITNVGWLVDRTQWDLYPRIAQTAGLDFTNPDNYRPSATGLRYRSSDEYELIKEFSANARLQLSTQPDAALKLGLNWRNDDVNGINRGRQWNYIGTGPLPAAPHVALRGDIGI